MGGSDAIVTTLGARTYMHAHICLTIAPHPPILPTAVLSVSDSPSGAVFRELGRIAGGLSDDPPNGGEGGERGDKMTTSSRFLAATSGAALPDSERPVSGVGALAGVFMRLRSISGAAEASRGVNVAVLASHQFGSFGSGFATVDLAFEPRCLWVGVRVKPSRLYGRSGGFCVGLLPALQVRVSWLFWPRKGSKL